MIHTLKALTRALYVVCCSLLSLHDTSASGDPVEIETRNTSHTYIRRISLTSKVAKATLVLKMPGDIAPLYNAITQQRDTTAINAPSTGYKTNMEREASVKEEKERG